MTQFRLTQISSALAAAGLLSATGAFAANIAGSNSAANVYIAPARYAETIVNPSDFITPVAGYGAKFKIQVPATGLGSNAGAIQYWPFYFNAAGGFIAKGAPVTRAANAGAGAVTLTLSPNTNVKSVAIVVTTAIGTDQVGTGGNNAAQKQVGVIANIKSVGGGSPTQMTYDLVNLPVTNLADTTGAAIAAGEETAIVAAINAINTAQKPIIPMVAYPAGTPTADVLNPGPAISRVAKVEGALSTTSVTVFGEVPFDVNTIATNSNPFDSISVLKTASLASASTAYNVTTQDAAGQWFTFNNGGAAFAESIVFAGAKNGSTVKDYAGNSFGFASPALANLAVTAFAKPAYAGSTAKAVITGIANLSDTNRGLLYTTGVPSAPGNTATVVLRLAEGVTTASAGDFAVVPSGLSVAANPTVSGSNVTLTLVPSNTVVNWTVNPATGALSYGGTPVTVKAQYEQGSALTTVAPGGQAMAAAADDLAATPVFSGLAQDATVATRDDNADGLLDGVTINFKQDIGTPAGADFTLKTKFNGTARDIAFTPTKVGTNSVKLVMNTPTTADWTEDGTSTSADTALYVAANFNTGLQANNVKYAAALATAPALTYSGIYSATTGELAKIGSGVTVNALPTTPTDGAPPLITKATFNTLQGTTPASGSLVLTASEPLVIIGTGGNGSQYSADASPLTLRNLNDGLGDVAFAAGLGANSDTITINGVSATAVTKALTIGATPGYRDNNALTNLITTAPAGVTIAAGNTVFSQPKLVQATAARAGGAVGGNITQIVLRLNKGVQLAPVGKVFDGAGVEVQPAVTTAVTAVEDGQFKVRAAIPSLPQPAGPGINANTGFVDISLRSGDVDLSQAASGYITLNIPAPGIVGTATSIAVDYQHGAAAGARLVSTDTGTTGPTVLNVVGGDFANVAVGVNGFVPAGVNPAIPGVSTGILTGGVDDNTITAQLPNNSNKLLVQEMTGKITTDGTAVLENGSIVRADLVKFDPATSVQRGTVRVPCDCTAGTQLVALTTINANLRDAIDDARRLGQTSIRVYVTSTKEAQTPSVVTAGIQAAVGSGAPAAPGTGGTMYEADLNIATGAVTSASGVTGSLVIAVAPALTVLDTAHQVMTATSNGVFRLSTGVNDQRTAAGSWWVVSVKRPTDTRFRMITSSVDPFINHVPFRQELAGNGNIVTANLGTVNMANLIDVPVANSAVWQLLPIKGVVALTSDAVRKTAPVTMQRLMMNVQAADGQPTTAWAGDGANDTDEAFTLMGNTLAGAVQVGTQSAALDGIKSLTGGFGLAWQNPLGQYRVAGQNANTAIATGTPLFITIPVSAANSAATNVPAGWSLITMNANKDLSVAANQGNINAAILVGAGQQSKTWFKGEATGNTLTTLEAGKSYFVNFTAATTAFGF
jgi:hypothetical protein